jgi:hypothetical protein
MTDNTQGRAFRNYHALQKSIRGNTKAPDKFTVLGPAAHHDRLRGCDVMDARGTGECCALAMAVAMAGIGISTEPAMLIYITVTFLEKNWREIAPQQARHAMAAAGASDDMTWGDLVTYESSSGAQKPAMEEYLHQIAYPSAKGGRWWTTAEIYAAVWAHNTRAPADKAVRCEVVRLHVQANRGAHGTITHTFDQDAHQPPPIGPAEGMTLRIMHKTTWDENGRTMPGSEHYMAIMPRGQLHAISARTCAQVRQGFLLSPSRMSVARADVCNGLMMAWLA